MHLARLVGKGKQPKTDSVRFSLTLIAELDHSTRGPSPGEHVGKPGS